jgi:hypothetical protein
MSEQIVDIFYQRCIIGDVWCNGARECRLTLLMISYTSLQSLAPFTPAVASSTPVPTGAAPELRELLCPTDRIRREF